MATLRDKSGVTVFEGDIEGGAAPPASCYLVTTAAPVGAQGSYPALWTDLSDDPWNTNPLAAIPDGLGLTFAFDGSDATITATEAGFWALSFLAVVGGADATYAGVCHDSFATEAPLAFNGISFEAAMSAVYAIPAGANFAPRLDTNTAAAGNPFANVRLVIVRLG